MAILVDRREVLEVPILAEVVVIAPGTLVLTRIHKTPNARAAVDIGVMLLRAAEKRFLILLMHYKKEFQTI